MALSVTALIGCWRLVRCTGERVVGLPGAGVLRCVQLVWLKAGFAAAFTERENFAGIERALGIEGVVDAAHEIEVGVGEEKRHEFAFFHADAVFAGEAAADFDAIANDFGGGLHGALELRVVAGIVENDGVKIAVAGVKDVADVEAVLVPISWMRRSVCGSFERGITPSST